MTDIKNKPHYNVIRYRTDDTFKQKQKERTKKYYLENKEKISIKNRERYLEKSAAIKEYAKNYRLKNKEALKKKRDIAKFFPVRFVLSARDDFYV